MNEIVKFGKIKLNINQKPANTELVPSRDFPYVRDERLLEKVALGVKQNVPVLLVGETGTGKTALVRYLARETGNPFRRVNLHGGIGAEELIGKVLLKSNEESGNAETFFQEGVLIEALRNGYWLLLDEVNATNPEILFTLHSLLDDDKMVVLSEKDGEIVKPHRNFRLFCGMNPSETYAGTRVLNPAFLSRFLVVELDFLEPKKEMEVLKAWQPKADEDLLKRLIDLANRIRKAYQEDKLSYICSTRDLIQFCSYSEQLKFQDALDMALVEKATKEDRPYLQNLASVIFGSELYKAKSETKKPPIEEELKKKIKRREEELEKQRQFTVRLWHKGREHSLMENMAKWQSVFLLLKVAQRKSKKKRKLEDVLKGLSVSIPNIHLLRDPAGGQELPREEGGKITGVRRRSEDAFDDDLENIGLDIQFDDEERVREGGFTPEAPFPLNVISILRMKEVMDKLEGMRKEGGD